MTRRFVAIRTLMNTDAMIAIKITCDPFFLSSSVGKCSFGNWFNL
jgi:hypothetical protein